MLPTKVSSDCLFPCCEQLPCPLTPTATPLEPSIRSVCQQRFVSVVSDLSSMALRVEGEGGTSTSHRPQCHPPGTQENGEPFLESLLQISRQLMFTDQAQFLHPFTDKVSAATCLPSFVPGSLSLIKYG